MDFSILYAIQTLRCGWLDSLILFVTKAAGSYGQCWVVLAAVLLIFKKTRKCGITMLLSYGLVYLLGQYGLKDLIARPRPCHLDRTVELIVSRPFSYSCPSTHSAWAFAAAASVFLYHKNWGLVVGAAALIIAFSRLYLFVHFPTDVLFGAVLGIVCGFAAAKAVNALWNRLPRKKETEK